MGILDPLAPPSFLNNEQEENQEEYEELRPLKVTEKAKEGAITQILKQSLGASITQYNKIDSSTAAKREPIRMPNKLYNVYIYYRIKSL